MRSRQRQRQLDAFLFVTDIDGSSDLKLPHDMRHQLSESIRMWMAGAFVRYDISWSELFWAGDGGYILVPTSKNSAEDVLRAAISFCKYAKSWLHMPTYPFGRIRLRSLLSKVTVVHRGNSPGTAASLDLSVTLKHERSVTLPDSLTLTSSFAQTLGKGQETVPAAGTTAVASGEDHLPYLRKMREILDANSVTRINPPNNWLIQHPYGSKAIPVEWVATCFPTIRNDHLYMRTQAAWDRLVANLTNKSKPLQRTRLQDQERRVIRDSCSEAARSLGEELAHCQCGVRCTYFRFLGNFAEWDPHSVEVERAWHKADKWSIDLSNPDNPSAPLPPLDSCAHRAYRDQKPCVAHVIPCESFVPHFHRSQHIKSMIAVPVSCWGARYGVLCIDFTAEVFCSSALARLETSYRELDSLPDEFRLPIIRTDPLCVESELYGMQIGYIESLFHWAKLGSTSVAPIASSG